MDNTKTIQAVIDGILHVIDDRTGFRSDDSAYSRLSLYHEFIRTRHGVLEDLIKNNQQLDQDFIQELKCVDLEEVDMNECPTRPESGCVWLRSTTPIPDYIKIISVTNPIGSMHFGYRRWDLVTKPRRLESSNNDSFYTIKNKDGEKYLYVYNNQTIKALYINAVFIDPIDPVEYCLKRRHCNPFELNISTPEYITEVCTQRVQQKFLSLRQGAGANIINNDSNLN